MGLKIVIVDQLMGNVGHEIFVKQVHVFRIKHGTLLIDSERLATLDLVLERYQVVIRNAR